MATPPELLQNVATARETASVLRSMSAALHDLSQPLTSVALALEVVAHEQDAGTLELLLVTARQECARAMRDVTVLRNQTNTLLNGSEKIGRD